ncbi:MAG: hypothetical protein LUB59_05275 [Candidatus Gastranaerophilales bacterium]|nr:hypothetical protein [Candidatus Gastranaerophilales bacterium]
MTTATKEEVITMEEALPLTVGDGSEYRTDVDDRGIKRVNKEKIVQGMKAAVNTYKPELPTLSGAKFVAFVKAAKTVAQGYLPQYTDDDITKVNSGGIIGNIANNLIKNKYGEK